MDRPPIEANKCAFKKQNHNHNHNMMCESAMTCIMDAVCPPRSPLRALRAAVLVTDHLRGDGVRLALLPQLLDEALVAEVVRQIAHQSLDVVFCAPLATNFS